MPRGNVTVATTLLQNWIIDYVKQISALVYKAIDGVGFSGGGSGVYLSKVAGCI